MSTAPTTAPTAPTTQEAKPKQFDELSAAEAYNVGLYVGIRNEWVRAQRLRDGRVAFTANLGMKLRIERMIETAKREHKNMLPPA